jgi:acetyl-CoA carboxylase carboxyltransferase component
LGPVALPGLPMNNDAVADLHARRQKIRAEMGGEDKLRELQAQGRLTVRERIDLLVDEGSFAEIGTFVRADRPEDRPRTPGDGKIGGHAMIDGRPVVVAGDDITVKHASNARSGSHRVERLYGHAVSHGSPFVFIGEGGGARIPDILGSEGITRARLVDMSGRSVPKVALVVGDSCGFSSFFCAFSDLAIQVRGTCMAVVSPRVIEMATGETVSPEELGGVDVHSKITGQIDVIADTEADAYQTVRQFLDLLPSNSWSRPQRRGALQKPAADDSLHSLVPENRRQAYDMKRVIARIVDAGSFLELQAGFARSIICGLARIGGWTVGVLASQPKFEAGAFGPDACDKATKLLLLCDAYDIPVVFLQDTPGFIIGKEAERARVLSKSLMLFQALMKMTAPRLTVILRKGFGLAFTVMGGPYTGSDLICAWPGAEISQMDPAPGANVLSGGSSAGTSNPNADGLALVTRAVDPYGAATIMGIDEVIDPADTRALLVGELERLGQRQWTPADRRPLNSWPSCW